MKRVLITGSEGVVGTVLSDSLPQDTTDFDLPNNNAEEYKDIFDKAKGHDAIVHLAWDFEQDGFIGDSLNPDNSLISYNVYQAAVDAGVKRVIMASSVHADKFAGRDPKLPKLAPFDLPLPDSPYGASKVMMEALGRYYADSKGLEVICIRFGGVNKADQPPKAPYSERQVWLSHTDCASVINACLAAESVPNNFSIIYAVSDNKDRLHDLYNPFDWAPRDGAK